MSRASKPPPIGVEDVMNDPLRWRKGDGGTVKAISNYSRVPGKGTLMYVIFRYESGFGLTLNGSPEHLLVKGKTLGKLKDCQFAAEQFDRCFCMAAMLNGKV